MTLDDILQIIRQYNGVYELTPKQLNAIKRQVATLEAENARLREALQDIRDLARTGLPAGDMSKDEWNEHRHYRIAAMVNRALEGHHESE